MRMRWQKEWAAFNLAPSPPVLSCRVNNTERKSVDLQNKLNTAGSLQALGARLESLIRPDQMNN